MRKIVITGVGAVTPLGLTAGSSFAAVVEGKSGIRALPFAPDPRSQVRYGADVAGLDLDAVLGKREARRYGRFTALAVAAAQEALADSKLADADYAPLRRSCIIGSGVGGLEVLYDAAVALHVNGPRRVSPFSVPGLIANMAAGIVSTLANAQGPCYAPSSACASGAHAIAQARALIEHGVVDVAIAGGTEACLHPLGIATFERMGALSKRSDAPELASRPFERDRDGFVLGEGAGVVILEDYERARRRGAKLYAELAGASATADCHHATQPASDGKGAANAMRSALATAGATVAEVRYINAHGTGTPLNDRIETHAIKDVFGEHAKRLMVSSTKGATGHLLGASGAIEAIFTALAVQSGTIPPTLNLENRDPLCDLDYVSEGARRERIAVALSNSFGFGGQNVSLAFRRVD